MKKYIKIDVFVLKRRIRSGTIALNGRVHVFPLLMTVVPSHITFHVPNSIGFALRNAVEVHVDRMGPSGTTYAFMRSHWISGHRRIVISRPSLINILRVQNPQRIEAMQPEDSLAEMG